MSKNRKYWKNLAELNSENEKVFEKLRNDEFTQEIPVDEILADPNNLENSSTSRRDFLKYIGFSTAAATLAACEGPVVKSIPYVVQPKEIIPGIANFYATTIANGHDYANILIKNREGRPIKVEKNSLADDSMSANARVHASVLDLYDNSRLAQPMKENLPISWFTFEYETLTELQRLSKEKKEIVLLTQTFASPSTKSLIEKFKAKFKSVTHIPYDSISESEALDAFEAKYGIRGLSNYDFSNSKIIISIGADFLGDWQGGGFDCSYAKGRVPDSGVMSRHIQFESNMTLSGANADLRVPLRINEQKLVLIEIYKSLFGDNKVKLESNLQLSKNLQNIVDTTIKELKSAKAGAVVITGIQEKEYQLLALEINEKIKSIAFQPNETIFTSSSRNKDLDELIKRMNEGSVGAVITAGVNPVYSLADSKSFVKSFKNLELSICFSQKNDETASLSKYVAASNHYLESWCDYEFKTGEYSLAQPVIKTLFNTKQFQDLLLLWSGSKSSFHDFIKDNWKKNILEKGSWNKSLHDGVFDRKSQKISKRNFLSQNRISVKSLKYFKIDQDSNQNKLELNLYTKTGMGDGQQANNPWLQEFPDPLTRATWDNYLTISEHDAKNLNLLLDPSTFFKQSSNDANGGLNGKYAIIKLNEKTIKVPVMIQPGQAKGTVGLSYG